MQLRLDDEIKNDSSNLLFLISCGYDGSKGKAYLKMYDPKIRRVVQIYDESGHLPYCLTNLSPSEAEKMLFSMISSIVRFEIVKKFDAIKQEYIEMTKIVAKDPLTIGGKAESIREKVPCWEADIPYHINYLYDNSLIVGLPYQVTPKGLEPVTLSMDEAMMIAKRIKNLRPEEYEEAAYWIRLLEAQQPDPPYAALDIEVLSPVATRVPSPSKAEDKVIAVSICGSDGRRSVFMLRREPGNDVSQSQNFDLIFYESEKKMLEDVFEILTNYAIIATFNGDEFDLPYLHNRANRLGVPQEKNPIIIGREGATFVTGAHIDLYSFFINKSVQVYAFDNKYREHTLEAIAQSLLGKGKVRLEKPISELSNTELAEYSFGDAELVYSFLTVNNKLLLRLIFVLARISRLPLEDLCRHGVSGWIKNLLYYEHRRRNWLIPRPEDILSAKGGTTTKAVIEGKKYRGAIVYEPVPGIHFDVKVLDFASLYPSALKRWNLSYETIRCPHEECKNNKVPETEHWVCTKVKGLQSLIVGALRDVRVGFYKPKSSDKTLSSEQRIWYDVVQKAIKVFLNASYGVFGFEEFPLYCPPLAESTAAIGRYVFKETINKVKSMGGIVIYGDTDSLFLKYADEKLLEDLIKWASMILGLDLEVDKEYVYIVFSMRKKNYLGLTTKGVVDVKGLTGKKRHIPEFIRAAFNSMLSELQNIKSPQDLEVAKEHISALIKNWYQKLKNREFNLEDLAFNVMLSKLPESYVKTTPPHVKAARLLKQVNVNVTSGDIISYVKTKDSIGVAPLHPKYPVRKEQIDIDKYIEYMRSTFEQVLDSLDLDFDKIVGIGSLEQFFA
ncbi:MAG: DNA-directed DNA polymerase I [Nitrososphaerota archaeon]